MGKPIPPNRRWHGERLPHTPAAWLVMEERRARESPVHESLHPMSLPVRILLGLVRVALILTLIRGVGSLIERDTRQPTPPPYQKVLPNSDKAYLPRPR